MHYHTKNILYRTIILLVLFFVCLPCSAKREIKLVLDVPVNELKNNQNSNLSATCFIYIDKTVKKALDSVKDKDLKKHFLSDFSDFQKVLNASKVQSISFPKKKVFKIIPIYLLHEQYLI
ncbi:hypothetical protein [Flavobacterium johnsoniae]|uniref:Uncharacterized protein n=1 Tax=Flavobacterium johnsoniae TaxID=986 RepID=A0A1J7CFV4_FLAJO|nr:hypothetical protein [Flavobacterium johnsoniae]OIV40424.1 hypothetical protein BKM63_16155 [Flavobacterium johnsoniae]